MNITRPIIHCNGTSKDGLFDGYLSAVYALEHAIDALAQTAPHGRDYYPHGDEAYLKARQEHEERLRLLNRVCQELAELATHCS